MVAIIDYGVGNLFSLRCSLEHIGADVIVSSDADEISRTDHVIFPGVGAFEDAANKLRESGLDQTVLQLAREGRPLLGICLGMQLLYRRSFEYGEHQGLGLLEGDIHLMTPELLGEPLKVPHMGWNQLQFHKSSPLLKYTREGDSVYYVHSYFAPITGATAASSSYGQLSLSGAVQQDNIYGTQFHPEKSGEVGLAILKAFLETEAV